METSDQNINYTKEAFMAPFNLTFLIVAMVTAFGIMVAIGSEEVMNLVLIMAAAAELLYLGIMPKQERFRRVVRSRRAAEHAKPPSQREIYQLLTKYSQRRYVRLRSLEKNIQTNYRKLSYASQGLLNSHLQKIDGLLDSYLNLLYQKERFEHAMQSTTESEVISAMASLRSDIDKDPPKVAALKQRRLKILEQRLDRFKKSAENMKIIEEQLLTIEDVTKYIHEQSLTLRNPDEITFQLDTLLNEVQETQTSVEEMESIFTTTPDMLSGLDMLEDEPPATTPPNRTRERS